MKNHPAGSLQSWVLMAALLVTAVISLAGLAVAEGPSSEPLYLYKATFVRAAPGKLLDLIALYKARMTVYDASGDERPFWWRHTEGDQWDLMLLFPMKSYADYYSKDKVSRRSLAEEKSSLSQIEFSRQLGACTAWHEDLFVRGAPLEAVKKAFENTAYYHLEIFVSLPGKQAELFKEREMENAYQVEIGRPENLIFSRDQGAAWDVFTLGCYRDLKHWAESGDVSKDKRDAAARKAGFANADGIGPFMRTLIDMHRDTMGVAIK